VLSLDPCKSRKRSSSGFRSRRSKIGQFAPVLMTRGLSVLSNILGKSALDPGCPNAKSALDSPPASGSGIHAIVHRSYAQEIGTEPQLNPSLPAKCEMDSRRGFAQPAPSLCQHDDSLQPLSDAVSGEDFIGLSKGLAQDRPLFTAASAAVG